MKATGIVRRIDDLGRMIVPKEIRRNLGIREGDPLEIWVDGNNLVFTKYEKDRQDFAFQCQQFVKKVMNDYVKTVNFVDQTVIVYFKDGKIGKVTKNKDDEFDFNAAICYACKQVGITYENPVCKE